MTSNSALNLLRDSLNLFSVDMEQVMLVGDFNARICELNQMNDDVISDVWFLLKEVPWIWIYKRSNIGRLHGRKGPINCEWKIFGRYSSKVYIHVIGG